jgi:nicotinamide phosphoribosyltransferase
MLTINPLLKTDSYKLSHRTMYPEGLTNVYSNYTSRGSRIEGVNHTVHFGLQAFLTDLQDDFEDFFRADKAEVVADYKRKTASFVTPGFTVEMVEDLHDLGYLPLRFSGLPEGTLVPIKVPSLTIESTHPDFAWLVNYFETNLSASIWHPSTSATTAWDMRRTLYKAAAETSSAPEAVDFQLHDFSYRGMENWQAAAASSAGHLLSFYGSDVVPAIDWVEHYYNGDNGLIAASVPATEHSVMCAGGKDDELETFRRLLKLYPEGILSVVSDTWDFWHVLTVTLPALKDEIMARNGKLVIRPDSGDPADIVCGKYEAELIPLTARYPGVIPEDKGAIELLWDTFGGTVNDKGFKELDSHIGLIYGDSITKARLIDINSRLARKGFASTNWVAGVGSYTYQMVTRDTFGSAVKATEVEINGVRHNIFKDPKTDSGLKKSATGRLAVLSKMSGELYLVEKATPEQEANSHLKTVWEDGKFVRYQSFAEVRETLKRSTGILERANALS